MSRAVGLSDDVVAVIPMHADMINHSSSPNLCLIFEVADDDSARIYPRDNDLLLKYKEVTEDNGKWNEEKATWLLHTGVFHRLHLDLSNPIVRASRTTNLKRI